MKDYRYNYSVIIPHYRDLESLERLIESIPNREDVQIIIVDDNSFPEEKTVERKIITIARDNLKLYFNQKEKRGAGGCRNIGIEKAEGIWLIFADADDYFVPGAFEAFDEYLGTHFDVVYFEMTSINLPEGTIGSRHLQYNRLIEAYIKKNSQKSRLNLRYNFPSPCAKMIKHEMVEKNRIRYDDVRWANDDMFATKCGYYASTIGASSKIVYSITRKQGTVSSAKSAEAFKSRLNVYISKMVFLKQHLTPKEFHEVTRWPGNKLMLAKLDTNKNGMVAHTMMEFKKNNISLLWINSSDFDEFWIKVRSYLMDRKYK